MTKVLDLNKYKAKKDHDENLARGRTPLYVSHLDGKVKGSPHLKRPHETNTSFEERMNRIKASLERINELMQQLEEVKK